MALPTMKSVKHNQRKDCVKYRFLQIHFKTMVFISFDFYESFINFLNTIITILLFIVLFLIS